MKVQGKIAVVAGGSSGIGLGIAQALAEKGAKHVVLLARNRPKLEAAAAQVNTQVSTYSVDLGKPDQVEATADKIREEIGLPDILINSAGAGSLCSIAEADDANIITHIESTCYAGFFLTRAFVNEMVERGSGHIVFVSSPAINVNFGAPAYIASRSAVKGLANSIRYDLSKSGVNVTYAEPSLVHDTAYFNTYPDTMKKFPLLFRSPRFRFLHQNSADAGRMIIKAVERNRRTSAHWVSRYLWLTGAIMRPIYDWFFRITSLPADQGGPLFPSKMKL